MPEKLKRVLTLKEVIIFGVGIIIGAGIYSIIGKTAEVAGFGIWISVLIAGIITLFTGLSFAEMTSLYPKTSSYFKLLSHAFGRFEGKIWGFIIEWFLVLASIFSIAAVSIAFGGYFSSFFNVQPILAALGIILFSSLVSYFGIKESVITTIMFTLIEVLGLIIIIVLGILLAKPSSEFLISFKLDYNIFYAATLIFFAFTGFELIPAQSEETVTPKKLIPKAIVYSIIICTIIYLLVAIAVVNLYDPKLLGKSSAPLVDIISKNFDSRIAFFVWVASIFSISNTVLGLFITSSRLLYGLGKEKLFPVFFKKLSKFKTPVVSILMISSISIVSTFLIQDLKTTAEIANLLTLSTFFSINASIIVLRRKNSKSKGFKVPLTIKNVPIPSLIGCILCAFLISQFPKMVLLNGFLISLIGLIFYFITKEKYII